MASVWPQSLPQSFLIEGFNDNEPDTSITSSVSAGVPKKRQRYTAAATPVTGKMHMTTSQTQTLKEFYKDTLMGGSLTFELKHPRESGLQEFRFRRPPSYEPVGIDWKVTLELDWLP